MGFLSGLFDTGASDARRLNLANMDYIKSLFGGMGDVGGGSAFGIANQQFQLGLPSMQQAVGAARGGYDQAIASAGGIAAGAERRASDQTAQLLANVRSQMRSTGLGNTSAMAGAQFGALEAGNRNALDVQSMRAQTMSPLYAGRGMAEAGALGTLAQYRSQFSNQMMGGAQALGGQMSQFQFAPGQSLFSQMAPMLGLAAGSMDFGALMKMFGGGQGAQ